MKKIRTLFVSFKPLVFSTLIGFFTLKKQKIITSILALLLIFLTGCSSIYTTRNFSSKQKFYDNFNRFAKDKNVKVTLTNDSSFYTNNPTKIQRDTLYVIKPFIVKKNLTVSTIDLLKIQYKGSDYKSADIWLKNGKEFKAENIFAGNDSLKLLAIEKHFSPKYLCPIDNVKTISYKNHWLGLLPGIPSGAIVGICVGLIMFSSTGAVNSSGVKHPYAIVLPPIFSLVAGTILGWLSGYNYVYQFNWKNK